ncbi:DUF2169 domain-containing protein [candidate division CSSED10-310 bacterium]|uniref:DUF2169 domain-containing protein n=1 Tax=candidate division CSSED10-310 bacterium TaxID=2855610 RepID=A0ABV6Z1S8_UNCC1
MNIVKAFYPGVLHTTYSYIGKHFFAVSSLWGFKLDSGEAVLEQKLWTAIADMLGKNEMFDAGMPKVNGEVLVHGSFCSPTGKAVPGGKVSVSIGSVHKELAVFGDRTWLKGLGFAFDIKGPAPMTEMPISYANAFGGEGFKKNPIGKGFSSLKTETGTIHPLPNVEYADRLIGSQGDRPEPASYGRLDIMWQQRLSKAGTYDEKYIRERMPGLPDDIDWNYFNDAAPDQWIQGYFEGTEPFEISHMNPEKPVQRGQLPGVIGRCFVEHEVDGQASFKEIPTSLDTVWFFPAQNLGVLIHRGALQVNEDDGCDIKKLLLAHENLTDSPRSIKHYQSELKQRTDQETAALRMMNSSALIPEGCVCAFKALQAETDSDQEGLFGINVGTFVDQKVDEAKEKMEEQKAVMASQLEESGIDPQPYLDKFDLSNPEESPEMMKINELIEQALPGAVSDPDNIELSNMNLEKFSELEDYLNLFKDEKIEAAKDSVRRQMRRRPKKRI